MKDTNKAYYWKQGQKTSEDLIETKIQKYAVIIELTYNQMVWRHCTRCEREYTLILYQPDTGDKNNDKLVWLQSDLKLVNMIDVFFFASDTTMVSIKFLSHIPHINIQSKQCAECLFDTQKILTLVADLQIMNSDGLLCWRRIRSSQTYFQRDWRSISWSEICCLISSNIHNL